MLLGHKAELVKRIKQADPTTIRTAISELADNGWLEDGALTGANLAGADLSRLELVGAGLRRTDLSGAALRRAHLRYAHLTESDLTGADLSEADLRDADLYGALLGEANLKGAQAEGFQLVLAASLLDAILPDGSHYEGRYRLPEDLQAAREEGIYPDRPERMAEWYEVSLPVYEAGQLWADEYLEELIGDAQVIREADQGWVRQARQNGALENGSLEGDDLAGCNFSGCDLSGARLAQVTLDECLLVRANLAGADLEEASLVGADLGHANLSGARCRGADLGDAFLDEANLEGADLTDADPYGAGLYGAQMRGAIIGDGQLVWADSLAGATLPGGQRYDGRYNLEGDLDAALEQGIDPDDSEQMSAFYEVDIKEYETGQKWASANLERLLGQGSA